MVRGIGTDILKIARLRDVLEKESTSFVQAVFTVGEQQEASRRPDPLCYFATRFAGKEAVFKCLGTDDPAIRLDDIEILGADTGQPAVTLTGRVRDIAEEKGITRWLLSLSFEEEYAVAFALAQT